MKSEKKYSFIFMALIGLAYVIFWMLLLDSIKKYLNLNFELIVAILFSSMITSMYIIPAMLKLYKPNIFDKIPEPKFLLMTEHPLKHLASNTKSLSQLIKNSIILFASIFLIIYIIVWIFKALSF